jgi:hypothetical protein
MAVFLLIPKYEVVTFITMTIQKKLNHCEKLEQVATQRARGLVTRVEPFVLHTQHSNVIYILTHIKTYVLCNVQVAMQ